MRVLVVSYTHGADPEVAAVLAARGHRIRFAEDPTREDASGVDLVVACAPEPSHVRLLRARFVDALLLVLSDAPAAALLDAGADDFAPAHPAELAARLAVLERQARER